MIRAVIFDCFGVIISDALKVEVDEVEATNPVAARQIIALIRANNSGEITPAESNQRTAQILGITVEAWRQKIEQGEAKNFELLKYAASLRRNYKTALLSNIASSSLSRRFTDNELAESFDVVVTSAELKIAKPQPEIYLHTAEKLGVEPDECVFTDDREEHCRGAEAVGMKAIWYRDFGQFRAEFEEILED